MFYNTNDSAYTIQRHILQFTLLIQFKKKQHIFNHLK